MSLASKSVLFPRVACRYVSSHWKASLLLLVVMATEITSSFRLKSDRKYGNYHKELESMGEYVLERSSKLYFPTEPRLPHEIRARIGETVTLTCEASGSPAPKVSWLRDGQPIPEVKLSNINVGIYSTVELANTIGKLVIGCVSMAIHESSYTCVAEHQFHKIFQSTQLHVLEAGDNIAPASNCNLDNISIDGISRTPLPAYVNMWMRRTVAMDGSQVVLYCRAQGWPTPKIEWFNPSGQRMSKDHSGRTEIFANGDLQINRVSWNDMGHFTCQASNVFVTQNVTSFIYPLAMV